MALRHMRDVHDAGHANRTTNSLFKLSITWLSEQLVCRCGCNEKQPLRTESMGCFRRALRVMRISLLAGELQAMRLSSSGALLSGAASSRLFQLITSVLTLLFTTSSIVSSLQSRNV